MATKSIAWNTGNGNITLTYQGQGDGTINVQSDANDIGTARSQVIIVETLNAAITRNVTVSQAACPFPVGDVRSYSYTGSYQEVTLPAGQYKLQCWGAQGGSNAAASSYSITAKAGGKGGYSEGIITLSQKTIVRVYVGGQGSSSAGGFNGGGSTSGSSSYSTGTSGQDGYEFGISKMGGGGGATDIRLSDGALLSRMIVAGGGSGGAMCYQKKTTGTTSWTSLINEGYTNKWVGGSTHYYIYISNSTIENGKTYKLSATSDKSIIGVYAYECDASGNAGGGTFNPDFTGSSGTFTASGKLNNVPYVRLAARIANSYTPSYVTLTLEVQETSSTTTTTNDSQVGFAGGGANGAGYSNTYKGKQNSAGTGGSFGQGANQTTTNYRYSSGAGGGGWYGGGGGQKSDSSMTYCKYSGGGSGFVNTAASASNRPSGYTGLQLDSGETKAGNTSFPNTAGTGNETGHSGNGYAKITRLS